MLQFCLDTRKAGNYHLLYHPSEAEKVMLTVCPSHVLDKVISLSQECKLLKGKGQGFLATFLLCSFTPAFSLFLFLPTNTTHFCSYMTYYFEVYPSKSNECKLNKAYVTGKTESPSLTKSMNSLIWALPLTSTNCFHGHPLWWPYFHGVMVSVFTILLICSQTSANNEQKILDTHTL